MALIFGLLGACTNESESFSDDGGLPASGGSAAAGAAASSGGTSGAARGGGGGTVGQGGTAQGGATGCAGPATLGSVTAATLNAELPGRTFLLIDVRPTPGAQIPGTDTNISANDTAALEAYIGSDKSRAVTIYCQAGHMVMIAGPALVNDGYCNVRYLVGGIDAWQAAGYPVTQ